MRTVTKILCRATGLVGLGIAGNSAVKVAKASARHSSSHTQEQYLARAYGGSRSIDHVDISEYKISKETFNKRMNNPIPAFWGSCKGAVNGILKALSNNLILISCSSLALIAKHGFFAKLGALGAVGVGIYNVARQGFGAGKEKLIK